MVEVKRSLHLRLQEYCDCYLETDPQKEILVINKKGAAADVTKDREEVALKFLCLTILYGIKESAKKITLTKKGRDEARLDIEAAGKYVLPAPRADIADEIFKVMRSITHLESERGREVLSLGLRNDRVELTVELASAPGETTLAISFPTI
ncbi:MAG TPA: hypothetical protein VJ624_07995 [Thermodesulfobacteriota bacterium]|nr:hypothetical protein [Thermodesulfobacteriota bacterium]